jgi:hypothetical protein
LPELSVLTGVLNPDTSLASLCVTLPSLRAMVTSPGT